jgi:hypothetical protein
MGVLSGKYEDQNAREFVLTEDWCLTLSMASVSCIISVGLDIVANLLDMASLDVIMVSRHRLTDLNNIDTSDA